MIRGAVRAALACAILAARPLSAQVARHVTVDLGGAATRFRVEDPGTAAAALSGASIVGHGALTFGRVSVEGSYSEGRLTPDSGTAPERDLVDGSLMLAFRPLRWLAVKGGPHLRAYVLPAGTRRWVFGEARVRAEDGIVGSRIRAHAELWLALSAEVNVGTGSAAGRGGEVGLTVRAARTPVWARLVYAIDRAEVGTRSETLEMIGFTLGYGGR